MTVRLAVIVVAILTSIDVPRGVSAAAGGAQAPQAPRPAPARGAPPPAPSQTAKAPPPKETFFTSKLTPAQMSGKQAVLETSLGTIVLDLLPEAAPNHVAHFITRASEGAYDGTIFHRVVPMGIVQGGDPLSKDPSQSAQYGTGGLRQLRFEPNSEKATRGAVAAVLVPNERDSAGSQFFICVIDQPALNGQYTVFARVVDGFRVAEAISTTPAPGGVPSGRVVIKSVKIRDKPVAAPEPFSTETVAELAKTRVVLETTMGTMTIELFPDKAPNHVRQFLRLAAAGIYDGTTFDRVVRDFVIQGGYVPTRRTPLDERQERLVRTLQPEFNDTLHDLGILAMAHGEDPASASTSFFIVLDRSPELDQKYTAFGRVVSGLGVAQKIGAVELKGEAPVQRIEVTKVTVTK